MGKPKTKLKPASASASFPIAPPSRFPAWLIAVMLVLATLALYWPAMSCDFVNLDDPAYVTENVHVQGGLTEEGVRWAFHNTEQAAYWAPVMWLSHELACQLFGLNPWGHHLMNVLLHAVNTALVFLLFRSMTGAIWRSLAVAALFGFHPLRVESVAWITERKDVLSACFGLLALIFYVRYARTAAAARQFAGASVRHGKSASGTTNSAASIRSRFAPPASTDYWLAVIFLALGLMSKAMLVTWPFVMLLLDYWPLKRFTGPGSNNSSSPSPSTGPPLRLILEKLPFFSLAAAASVVTFVAQKQGGAVSTFESLPPGVRIENAFISYCRYLGKLFWPADLAVFYPHPKDWPAGPVLLAGGLLAVISVLLIVKRGRYPFALMGWLWFCGTLVPVIQLVQSGEQAMADRFTYLPSLGVLLIVVWGIGELTRHWRHQNIAIFAGGGAIILCCGLTRHQLGYWKDSETLFRHALAVTEKNYLAHNNLGVALDKKGQFDEAFYHYQETIRLNPNYVESYNNLGTAFNRKGQTDEAIAQYREAIRRKPNTPSAHYNLGNALDRKGQLAEAIVQYQEAIRLNPDFAEAHNNLGIALLKNGRTDEAIHQFREAIRLKSDYPEAHYNLGIASGNKGSVGDEIGQYREAVRLRPDYAEAHYNLGTVLGRKGQTDEAINQFQEAVRLKPDFVEAHYNLGTLLGTQGRVAEAIEHYRKAIEIEPDYMKARFSLANALSAQGRAEEAIEQYQQALKQMPNSVHAHYQLGVVLQGRSRFAEAGVQFQKVLQLDPGHVAAQNNLAWLLATCPDRALRDGSKAVVLAKQAAQLSKGNTPEILDTLAAAYAEAGNFPEAAETAQKALELSIAQNKKDLTELIRTQLKLFESRVPYHEQP
jgi:protein O-mannosyl-transferase